MGVLKDVLKAIQQRALGSSSFLNKLKSVHDVGGRLAPPRDSRLDAQIGGRIDFGTKFTGKDGRQYQNVNFQLNKEAQNSSIRQLVKKNGTHKKYAEVPVCVSEPQVATEKTDENGKTIKLKASEIENAKQRVLRQRMETVFKDIGGAL